MRIVVLGSIHWSKPRFVEDQIEECRKQAAKSGKSLLVIHGGEPGAEAAAAEYCRRKGIDHAIYPANLARGAKGYFRRNQLMLQENAVDLVLIFVYENKGSEVVNDMIERASRLGIEVRLIDLAWLKKKYNPANFKYGRPVGSGGG